MTDYIERTEYQGKWQIVRSNANVGTRSAAWFAEYFGAGNEFVLWEYQPYHNGRQLFTRTRCIGQENGRVHEYDSEGRLVLINPADRKIQFLAAKEA